MIYLGVALCLSLAVHGLCVLFLLWYLAGRDEREAADRQVWANRVQAPEVAVEQTIDRDPTPEGDLFVRFDDDEAFAQAAR